MSATSFRFLLDALGQTLPVSPNSTGTLTLSKERADNAFYLAEKLSGPLVFAGADFDILYGLDQSTARCEKLGLRLLQDNKLLWQGSFTTSQCEFNLDRCTASVTVATDDGYTLLTSEWAREYNMLSAPAFASPTTLTTNLKDLIGNVQAPGRGGIGVEFLRIDTIDDEVDYIGSEGWTAFLRDTSYIGPGRLRQRYTIVFRYVIRGLPQVLDTDTGTYRPVDKSGDGWEIIGGDDNATPPTVDYAKAPEIAGFKTYKIGTYSDWQYPYQSGEIRARAKYGNQLLILPCGTEPVDYGYDNDDYIEVTGPGGAYNDECEPCLNLRRTASRKNCRSLWWKFGAFEFRHCAPLLDVLHYLLRKTAPVLAPPTPAELSTFYSAPTNPVTGSTDSELPRIYVAAGSDIKRPTASEPASRLLVSLKTFLDDLQAGYDVGYYIDPETGFLRLEHRVSQADGTLLDARSIPGASLPAVYSYREQSLPRYQQLTIANAATEDVLAGVSFSFAELAYAGNCVNQKEGENTQTKTMNRLTGDLAGLLLSGDSLPDTCIALLIGKDGTIDQANEQLSADYLLSHYHLHDGVLPTATLSTGDGTPQTPVSLLSVRPPRSQDNVSVPCVDWLQVDADMRVATTLTESGQITKAILNIRSGVVVFTLAIPPLAGDQVPPIVEARQFDNSFSTQFP